MAQENINNCIICNSKSISTFLDCKDHFVTQTSFSISSCNDCGFCFTNPRPDVGESLKYYDSNAYISHSKTSRGLVNRLFHFARSYTLKSKRRILNKYVSGKRLLDYGCGTGDFLGTMKNSGWSVIGIEPNELARNEAINTHGLKIHDEAEFHVLDNSSLDCISLWHVLEHVYPLEDRIAAFHDKLDADGTLIVALPNMNSYDAKRYGTYWAAYDVPRHIYHFNPHTIKALMSKHGFEHIKTKAMIFDSFYISLLSEKYKHGSNKFFSAMILGLISNLAAFLGKRNYSSLIYIFKKSK